MMTRMQKRMRMVLLHGAFLWFISGVFAPAFALLNIDTSYDGMYRGQPAFDKLLADLPFVYQEAMQRIHAAIGMPIPDRTRVVVVFSDHLTHNGMRLRGKRRSIEDTKGILHYIYLDLEFLVTGHATLSEEMTHELTHALMAETMGLSKYDSLPMWVKEGTAVHAADQGLARIKALLRRGVNLAAIGTEDEATVDNPISLEKYVENYLKVQFLLKSYGQEKFSEFIKRLLVSGDTRRELAASFNGLTEDVMNVYAHDFIARTLIANSRPLAAREGLARGMRFFEEREYHSARLALEDAVDAGLTDMEFQKAAYLLGECFIQERNPEAAFTILQRVKPDSRSIPVDRYQFLNAYTQYAMGLITEAYFGFKAAFEVSTSPAVQEGALYYIVRILLELENNDEAGRILGMLRIRYPRSSYLPLATAAFASRGRP
ncbi:MAG: tetratricopeptide repeat protein [Candidatus Ozemobacteraceae bacterium]